MKTDMPDKTLAALDTPAFRQQRVTALRRELDEALGILAETATVLTNAGAPSEVDGVVLSLADRLRWLINHRTAPRTSTDEILAFAARRAEKCADGSLRDMVNAHADGWHADLPREGCPECQVQYRRRP